MTENEAIKRIRTDICRERGAQRFCRDSCMHGVENCAYSMAISALEEIQQYRELGTVEELAGIQNGYFTLSQKVRQYEKLGTVEELRKAMEKQDAKIPDIWGNGYDNKGNMIYDMYDCPNCGKSYEIDYEKYGFCPNCGQAIDWSR